MGDRAAVTVSSGADVSLPFAQFQRARAAEVLRRLRLFADEGGLLAPRAGADLLGRRAVTLPSAPADASRVQIDDLPLLADVDPAAALLPALASGRISGVTGPGTTLAIALNGTVRAIATAYRDADDVRFSALLPPSAFSPGRNEIEVYAVRRSATGAPSLAALPTNGAQGSQARLDEKSARIELAGGRSLRIDREAVAGFIEKVDALDAGHLSIGGWAADPRRRAAVDQVLVFADRRLLARTSASISRPDVARTLGRAAANAGYQVRIAYPSADRAAADPSRLSVFAVLGGRASELKRLSGGGG